MTAQDFLELLLPAEGFLFTATMATGGGWINTCHKTIEEAVAHVNDLTFDGKQAYFAVASYKEARVWNEQEQKFQQRTQANTLKIKSFFLDLDVGEDEHKFPSKAVALAELKEFVKKNSLPSPMIVDSGGGIHAYWPLTEAVTTEEWKPVANRLKQLCIDQNFKADKSLTSDQARVLRCLGGYNYRRGAQVRLIKHGQSTPFKSFSESSALNDVGNPPAPPTSAFDGAASNLESYPSEPKNFDQISFSCAQISRQVASRGADSGEQTWRATLGVIKFCENSTRAAHLISQGHPEYNPTATLTKLNNWKAGPSTCEHFHSLEPTACEACPHWKQITSPIQLGVMVEQNVQHLLTVETEDGQSIEVALPDPPFPYARTRFNTITISRGKGDDPDTKEVSPYDIYPTKILRQDADEQHVDERSMWRVHLPRSNPVDMDIKQSMLADSVGLFQHLMAKGIYLSPENKKEIPEYMSAYLRYLAESAEREKLYDRLGWHDDRKTFVLGDYVLRSDGTKQPHIAGKGIRQAAKDALKPAGTMAGWNNAIQFYNKPNFEGHRFFLYTALAAPIFHMTAHKGVTVTACGESGRGKTTCLLACASMWGEPESFMLNGNKDGATYNKLYDMLGTFHSLPFLIDDTTERDPDEIRRMVLNMPQGKGKERMTQGDAKTWETIALTSANTDDISRIQTSAKDVNQSLMRLVSVEFGLIDTSAGAKSEADEFLRQIRANYGFAGPAFIRYVIQHYSEVKALVEANIIKIDRLSKSRDASAERFWTATMAAAYTAAQITNQLGLIEFPFESDLLWMIGHLKEQREVISEGRTTPSETFAEFLDKHQHNTLILSQKHTSNLDNVASKPTQHLYIRHELDVGIIYVSRTRVMDYCSEVGINFRKLEGDLEVAGVVVNKSVQKVLGADSPYAKGQVRAWKVDVTKLGGVQQAALRLVQDTGTV